MGKKNTKNKNNKQPSKKAVKRAAEKELRKAAKFEMLQNRNKYQEPIKERLKARNCPHQEIGNMFRSVKCKEALWKHQDPVPVRFCYSNYPARWMKSTEEIQHLIQFVNNDCSRNGAKKPIYSNNVGGYLLLLMQDEASAEYVNGLLDKLNSSFPDEGLRVPSLEEIKTFHDGWEERSPNMFSKYLKGGALRVPKPKAN
ncbi:hypothetical protein CpipJ_CPIJ010594 [Culex quinquefasciatus]|uniref:Uncharacterized protein n=1 Tax=Culex quinquefasciatus TaxID=7176 RepID=B0WT69_CULQU|nr:uncharacterized protein LOC6042833 [Culex quinquefasciatus]EDS34212.1 hypothetical protein CpipJ_CPIJ010594 [Culex quinquefasciatus]|eukprot:XP_001870830.1 hypothetical protein CpipJ_CPIJ010594 [Culex quinquefasciatus]